MTYGGLRKNWKCGKRVIPKVCRSPPPPHFFFYWNSPYTHGRTHNSDLIVVHETSPTTIDGSGFRSMAKKEKKIVSCDLTILANKGPTLKNFHWFWKRNFSESAELWIWKIWPLLSKIWRFDVWYILIWSIIVISFLNIFKQVLW